MLKSTIGITAIKNKGKIKINQHRLYTHHNLKTEKKQILK